MLLTDSYGLPPGLTGARETYEQEFRWGSAWQALFANGLIDGTTVDVGNTPTYELRPGLLLGQNYTTGKYVNYSPTATNGAEVAAGILLEALRMQDFTGANVDRFYAILVGGPVQSAKIIGLDLNARQQMDNRFIFDDSAGFGSIAGNRWFPWKRQITKTANYTLFATDNYTLFDNTGATGEVDLTLPAIANGYYFGASCRAAQVLKFVSNEGGNVVGTGLTNSSVSVTAVGGLVAVYSNPAGTKWIVEQRGTQTITAA